MKKVIQFTNEQLELIRCLRFEKFNDSQYGIDNYDLFGGTFLYEQMALILGYQDKVIKGTEEDYDGPKYPTDIMNKFIDLDEFIVNNIEDIEDIIHQFSTKGGISVDTKYISYDYEGIWHTEEEWKQMKRR